MPDVAERSSDMGIVQSTAAQATAAQISPAFFDIMLSFWIVELWSEFPLLDRPRSHSGIEGKRVQATVRSAKADINSRDRA
jgi:hypothetical protein